ncbi:protease inhibitor I42 family protein [Neisseria sp. Ec49-e6-T10]|uniref:protease inhibitor I42 family protein n=1 Tax=Neisseria sp. Ec49-e6-T10 TaxID=3140744 RepID=UPI003EBDEF6D
MKSTAVLSITISFLVLAACSSMANTHTIRTIKQTDSCTHLTLKLGEQVAFELPSNPTTGYSWQITQLPADILAPLDTGKYTANQAQAEQKRVGSGGKTTWRYQAIKQGQDTLKMTYLRPWEKDASPAEHFECAITVQ